MARLTLALLAALLLAAAPAPARADDPVCKGVGPAAGACVLVEEDGACASAVATGGMTDFAVGGVGCAESRWYGPCASFLGGVGTLAGLYGVSGWTCLVLATGDLQPLAGCVFVHDGPWGLVEPACTPLL